MLHKIKKTIFTSQFFVFALAFITLVSCEEEKTTVKNHLGEETELNFSKNISLQDEDGNTLSFDIYSDDQALLDSYSSLNYEFKGLTADELALIDKQPENEEVEEDENLSFDNPISVLIKNEVVTLKADFVGYKIIENWDAPKELEDRGYDWHWQAYSPFDYAQVENNRCCARIEASWYHASYNGGALTEIKKDVRISGGSSSSWYGQQYSSYIILNIKYRKGSHKTVYYRD